MEVGMALAAITSMLTILELRTQAGEIAAIVKRHYAPIAAMPAFARWLEAAPRSAEAESLLTATREQAVSLVNSLLSDHIHHDPAKERQPTSVPGNPPGWASLTRAERRVAELVSAGMTNREIATQLVVSVRTIDTHVAHVLRKLDLRSRVQLAAMLGTQQDQ
jgi:DNA-binding NarL/FixJ family response regulator